VHKVVYKANPVQGDNLGSLTMTTCYPFNLIGSAPDRYIVSANLVENK
jgi:sortase (surface protein transpeptidase)